MSTETAQDKGLQPKHNLTKTLKVSEAALVLGVSASTLRNLEKQGRISSQREDNKYRTFREEDVLELRKILKKEKAEKKKQQRIARKKRLERYAQEDNTPAVTPKKEEVAEPIKEVEKAYENRTQKIENRLEEKKIERAIVKEPSIKSKVDSPIEIARQANQIGKFTQENQYANVRVQDDKPKIYKPNANSQKTYNEYAHSRIKRVSAAPIYMLMALFLLGTTSMGYALFASNRADTQVKNLELAKQFKERQQEAGNEDENKDNAFLAFTGPVTGDVNPNALPSVLAYNVKRGNYDIFFHLVTDFLENATFRQNITVDQDAQVTGELAVTGQSNLNGGTTTPTLTFNGIATMNNLLAIDDTTEATLEQALDINGDVVSVDNLGLTQVRLADEIDYAGTFNADGTINVTGTIDLDGNWQIAGSDVNVTADELNTLADVTTTSGGIYFSDGDGFVQDASNLFYNNSSDRLGVGTNSPNTTLEVEGTITTDSIIITTGATNNYILTSDANGNATWQAPSSSSQWTLNASDLYPNSLSYNVGIGTSDPSERLEVNGNILITSGTLTIGSIGVGDTGVSNATSGASLIGVFDEFANSSATNIQDVLDDLDAAIGGGGSKWTDPGTRTYLTDTADDLAIGGSEIDNSAFYFDIGTFSIITEGSTPDGAETTLTFTDPSVDRTVTVPDASGTLALGTGTANQVAYWSGTNTLTSEAQLAASRGGTGLDTSGSTGIASINAGTWSVNATLSTALGGTGVDGSSAANGQLLIGNGTGYSLANLTAGVGIGITNAAGSITINNSLGTSIETGEIANGTILEADLDVSNTAVDNYVLTYNSGGSNFTWVNPSALGTNYWQQISGVLAPATIADDLAIGGTGVSDAEFFFDVGNELLTLRNTTGGNSFVVYDQAGNDTTPFVIDEAGSVGIGTSNPGFTLDVNGTLRVASTVQLDSVAGGTDNTVLIINGSGQIVSDEIDSRVWGTSLIDGSGVLNGVAYFTDGDTITSEAQLAASRGGTGLDGSSAANGQLLIGNGTGYSLANLSAGVGIGITNAAGSITINNSLGTSIETGEITDGTILEADLDVSNTAVDNYVLTYNSGGLNFTWVDPSTLGATAYWQQISGALSPSTISNDLAVGGTAASDAEFFFDVGNELLTLRNTTGGNSFVVYDQAGNDTTPFVIDGAGNVGIGTSNPGFALDVNGTVRLASTVQLDSVAGGTDDTVLILNGSGQIVSDEIDSRVWGTTLIDGTGSANGVAYFTDGDTIASEAQLAASRGGTGIDTSGSTGVPSINSGTWSVSATLSTALGGTGVDGSSAANGQLLIGNGTGYSLANLTAGVGIGITNAAGSITINNSLGTTIETGEITDGTILEADLDVSNTAVDNYVLTYNSGGSNFTWVAPASLGTNYWQQVSGVLAPATIADDLAIGGTGVSDAEFFFDVGNELLTLRNTTGGNSFIVYDQAGNDTTPFVIDEAGSVGIGTSNPGFALDVNGTVRIASTVQLDSVVGGTDNTVLVLNGSNQIVSDEIDSRVWGTSLIDGSGVLNGVAYFTDGDTITSEAQLSTSRGGTGLDGSSAANGQLLIGNGTGYSLGTLTAGVGIGITNAAGSITINNSLGTSIETGEITDGTILEADLDVSNTAVDNYVLTYNSGGSNFTWVNPSALGTNYWQQISGVLAPATIADDLAIGGTGVSDAEFFFDVGNELLTLRNTTGGNSFVVYDQAGNDTTPFVIDEAGSVGIGTSNPGFTLDINGTLRVASTVQFDSVAGGTDNTVLVLNGSNQIVSDEIDSRVWGTSLIDGSGVLNGVAYFTDGDTITSEAQLSTSRGGTGLDGSSASNGQLLIGNGTGYSLANLTAGVGIGITNAAGSITINNSLGTAIETGEITDGTILEADLDVSNTAVDNYVLTYNSGGLNFTWVDPATLGTNYWNQISGVLSPATIADDLAVGGTAAADAEFFFDVGNELLTLRNTTGGNSFVVYDQAGNDTTPFVIDEAGNVGIGTSNPGFALDVNGTVRLASTVQLDSVAGGTDDTVLILNGSGQIVSDEIDSRVWGTSLIDGSGVLNGVAYFTDGDTITSEAQLSTSRGGTGLDGSSAANGQLLIGNGTGYSLGTLTAGVGIGITNAAGSITINNSLGTSIETGEITDGTILEADLDVSNTAVDNYVLTYNAGGNNFTWIDPTTLGGTGYWQQNAGVLAPLTVSDDLAIGGTTASDAEFFFDVGNELLTLRNTTGGNSFVVYDQSGNDTTPFVIDEAGSVGIGTSNPGFTLDVNGTLRVSSTAQLDSVAGGTDNTVLILNGSNQIVSDEIDSRVWGTSLIDGSGVLNGVAYFTDGDTITSEAQLAASRGGTGLDGSSAANGQLLIGNGTGYSLANLTAGVGIGITNAAGSITINNSLGTSIETGEITDGTILEADLDVSNTAVDNYVLTYNSGGLNFTWVDPASLGTSYWQQVSGVLSPATIADDLAVGGTGVSDAEFFFDVGNELLTLRNTTGGNSFVVYDQAGTDATPFLIDEGGNVAIGGTNPAAALTVGEASEFRVNSSGNITRINNVAYSWPAAQAAGAGYILSNDSSGNLTWVDSSGVGTNYWQQVSGVLSPATIADDLAVGGTAAADAEFFFDVGNELLTLRNTTGGNSFVVYDQSGTDATPFLIDEGGNVAIGGTNPATALTVGEASEFRVNSSGNITRINNVPYSWPAAQAAGSGYVLSNDSSGNLTWVDSAGVGTNYWNQISGVLSPATIADDLAVGGTAAGDAEFFFDVGNELLTLRNTTGGNSFVVYDQAGNDTTPFVIDEAGSVGIGTSNPGFALDVNGTVRVASTVQLDSVVGGTDNTVLVLNGSNQIVSDEIDSRVWGTSLIDGSGVLNGVAYFTDGDTITSEAQLSTSRGGTGLDGSSAANGQLLIGNGTGYSLANLTAGVGIGITNAAGSITINNSLGTSIETGEITNGTILEADLDVSNTAVDNYVLTYNSGGSNFTWVAPASLGTNYWQQVSGVLSPATIADDLAVGGTAAGDAEFFFDVGNELLTLRNTTGGNSFVVYDQAGNDTTPFVIDEAGSVGIGTSNPGFALDVNGTVRIASTVQLDSVVGGTDNTVLVLNGSNQIVSDEIDSRVWGTSLIDGSGVLNGVAYFTDGDTITSEAQLSTSRGGTGLDGSSAANGQLLIGNGTGYSLGTLTAGVGIGITNAAGSITINNSLGTSIETGEITDGTILEADLDVSNTAVDNYVLTYNAGGSNFTWVNPSSVGTNYWQQVSGVLSPATIADDLAVGGTGVSDAEFFFDVGNELLTLRNTTGGNSFVVYDQAGNDTTPFVIDEAGSVGIGTSNPGFALDVNGTVRIASTVQLDSVVGGTDNTVLVLNGSNQIISDEIDSRVWGTSLIDGSGVLNGVAYFTDGDTITSEAQLSTSRGGTGLDGSSAANGQLLIGNGTGYSLGTLTAGVGIGITNAAGSITINNSLGTSIETGEITDGTILEADLDVSNTAVDNYVLTYNSGGSNFTWVAPASLGTNYWQQVSGVLSPATIADDLAVGGTAAADAEFFFDVGNELLTLRNTTGGNSFVVYDQAGNDTTPFVIDEAGNVGIGTSNPGFALDVNGTVRIASTVQLDSVAGGTDNTVLVLNGSNQIVSDEIDSRVWGTSLIDGSGVLNGVAYFTDGDTITSEAQLSTSRGGTGLDGSSAANGQLLIGNGTGYSLANLTAGVGIGITNAAGSITINNSLGTSIETGEITDGTILEADLDVSNTAVDNYVLTYNSGGLNFTWVDPSGLGTNYWTRDTGNGIVYPATIADDLAVGGTGVSDAEFFFDVGNELLTLRNTTGGNSFVVYDQAGNDTTPFVIDEAGNVGIGTSNPGFALDVNGTVRLASTVQLDSVSGGTDNTVLVLNGSNQIISDEIDSRVWGTSLIDGSGVLNGVAYFTDGDTITSEAQLSTSRGGTGLDGSSAANGQLLIGNGTGYSLANLTAGVGIGITNAAGSITINNSLGTSIETGEITDGTILEADLDVSNTAVDNYVLTYNSGGLNFTWVDPATLGATGYWQRNSGVIAPLTVADDLAIGGTTASDAEFFFDVGNELLTLRNTTGGNSFVVYDQAGNDTTPFVIDEAGSVGIGTSNPGFALDVNGTVRIASTVQLDSVSGGTDNTVLVLNGSNQIISDEIDSRVWGTSLIDGSGVLNGVAYFTDGDTITSEAQLSTSRGGTGLDGSSAANGQLLIGNGTGYSLGTLTAGVGIGITNAAGSITINNSLGTSIETGEITDGTILEADLDVSNTAVDNYVLTYNSGGLNFTWVNPSSVGTNYWQQVSGVLSPATIADDLAVGGTGVSDAEFFFDVGNELLTLRNTTGGNSFVVYDQAGNDTTPFVIDEAGNVGIGTSNPGFALDVNGTVRVAGTVQLDSVAGGTDDTVLILNGSGQIVSDEIDSRVWGTSLIDGSGVLNGVAYFTDTDTITSEAQLSTSRGGTGLDGSSAANGQLLIGNGTGYSLGTLTAGVGIGITNASGSITINNSLGTAIETGEITDGTILEADLDISNTAVDNYVLTYNSGGLNFTWVDPATLGTNYWTRDTGNGIVYPATTTDDLAIGGTDATDGTFFVAAGTGNITTDGDLAIDGGDLTTGATTFNLLDTTATTINFGGAATTLDLGAATGTTTVNNDLNIDGNTILGDASGDTVTSTAGSWTFSNATTVDLANSQAAALNFESGLLILDTSTTAVDIAGELDVALNDGDTINFDGDGSPTADLVQIGSGDTSATDGVDALQLSFGVSAASGNVIDITPSYADATAGGTSETYNIIDIDAFTATQNASGDTGTISALNVGNLTQTETAGTISATALAIGTGWDNALTVGGTTIVDGLGNIIADQLSGTLFTAAGDTGTSPVSQGETFTIVGGNSITTTGAAGPQVTVAVTANSLDYDEFEPALNLDTATSLTLSTFDYDINLDSSGVFSIQDDGTDFFIFDDDSTVDVIFPAAGQFTIDATSTANTTTTGILDINTSSATNNNVGGLYLSYTAIDDDAADTLFGNRIDLTIQDDTTASDTVYGTYTSIVQNDTTPANVYGSAIIIDDAGTSAVTAGLLIDNQQATDIDLTDAILIQATTADSIVDAIDVSDAEITNAINVGANNITGTTYTISGGAAAIDFTSFDVDSSGNIITAGDIAVNGGDLTSTATTFNFDVGDTGDIFFRDGTNTLLQISDEGTTGNLYGTGAFNFGDTTPDGNAYNTIGTGDATNTAGGEITDASDLFVSDDLEVGGTIFVAGTLLDSSGNIIAGYWTNNGTATYLTDVTEDLAIGGSSIANSALYFDEDIGRLVLSGSIGIGTTSPASELHVAGTTPWVTIGDGDAEDTALSFDGNAQDFYIALDDSLDDLIIGTGSTVGANEILTLENTGEVGIGITNPAVDLHVVGNRASATVGVERMFWLEDRDTATASGAQYLGLAQYEAAPASSSSALYVPFIGFGLRTGSNAITGRMYGVAASVEDISTNTTTAEARALAGQIAITTSAANTTLTNAMAGHFQVNNQDANSTISNAFGVYVFGGTNTSTVTSRAGVAIGNSTATNSTNYTNLLIDNAATPVIPSGVYSIFNESTRNNYFAGDLGIGISSPANELHVYSNDTGDLAVSNGAQLILEQDSTGDAGIQFELTGGKIYSLGIDNSSSDNFVVLDGSTERLRLDSSTGEFRVANDAVIIGSTTLGDASGDTVTSNAGSWTFANATAINLANTQVQALNFESGLLNLDTSNTRVGIGTTAPTATLDVVGSITASGDLTLDGGDITGANSAAIDIGEAGSGNIEFYADGDTDDYIYTDTTTNLPGIYWGTGMSTNDAGIRISATDDTGQLEYRDQNSGTWVAFDSIGGASTTLDDAYNNDADGSDATIGLTSTDGSIIVDNPSSSGTASGFLFRLNNQATSGTALDVNVANTSGELINVDWNASATQAGAITGLDLDFTNLTTDGTNSLYGLHINDQVGNTASTEYAIYQQGTNWDFGGFFEDDFYIGGNLGIGDSTPTARLDVASTSATAAGLNLTADSLTTGTGSTFSFDALTSGTGILVESDGSNTITGDLFRINIGASTTVTGNLFTIEDDGTELFSVGQSQITSALPHQFTAAGDVSFANDIQFTSQTASYIKSNAPLYIEAGESFENNDLTFITYGTGDAVFDLKQGNLLVGASNPAIVFDTNTATDTDFWFGVLSDQGGDNDDILVFGDGTTVGTNNFVALDTNGNFGIGTTAPSYVLTVEDNHNSFTNFVAYFHNLNTGNSASGVGIQLGPNSNPTSDNNFIKFIDGDGTVVGAVEGNGTNAVFTSGAADFAELMIGDRDRVGIGDILCLDRTGEVVAATQGCASLAAYSNRYIVLGNAPEGWESNDNLIPVGLLGQLEIKVKTSNGTILPGDPIAVSDIAGVGEKAVSSGQVVGYAIEGYINNDPTKVGKIEVMIRPSWYDPTSIITASGNLAQNNQETLNYDDVLTKISTLDINEWTQGDSGVIRHLGPNSNEFYEAFGLGKDGQIETVDVAGVALAGVKGLINRVNVLEQDQLDLESLEADILGLEEQLTTVEQDVASLQDEVALLSEIIANGGVLGESTESTESTEATQSTEALDPSGVLASIVEMFSQIQDFVATLGMHVTTDDEGNEVLAFTNDVNMTGNTTLYNATITGTLDVGLLKIDSLDNSVNVTGAKCYNPLTGAIDETLCDAQKLSIQNSFAGNVEFFDGSIKLTPDGTLEATTIIADSVVAGSVSVREDGGTVGKATVNYNTDKVTIYTTAITNDSKVFVTARSNTNGEVLRVDNVIEGVSYDVILSGNAQNDIEFDWLIVN